MLVKLTSEHEMSDFELAELVCLQIPLLAIFKSGNTVKFFILI